MTDADPVPRADDPWTLIGHLNRDRYRVYRRDGYRIWLNVSESRDMARRAVGRYEPEMFEALGRLLPTGGTFLDIGANKGDFSLFATEGGTAALTYIFQTLHENGMINPGDKIALGTPIFSPYLEIPPLADYRLDIIDVRMDEDAVKSTGLNTTKLKLFAFMVSAAVAGVAGALYIHYLGSIAPRAIFDINFLFTILVAASATGRRHLPAAGS